MTIRDLIRDGFDIDAPLALDACGKIIGFKSATHVPDANSSCPGRVVLEPCVQVRDACEPDPFDDAPYGDEEHVCKCGQLATAIDVRGNFYCDEHAPKESEVARP